MLTSRANVSKRILLIDDSTTIHVLMRTLLKKTSYEVLSALNGEAGLDLAVRERPDLVLLDLVLPRLDGFEVCRRLRASPKTRYVPVLILTTCGEASSREAGYQSGCTDYVTKPIDGLELLCKLRNYLGERS